MTINEAVIYQQHPEYKARLQELTLLRRASSGKLINSVPLTQKEYEKSNSNNDDTYIYRFVVEGSKAYTNRLQLGFDVPITAKFANSYAGKITHAGFSEIHTGLPKAYDLKFQQRISNKGQSINSFMYDLAREGAVMGSVFVLTDTDLQGNPTSFIVPIESIIDWHIGADGLYDLFVYTAKSYKVKNRKREVEQIVYEWHRDKLVKYSRVAGREWGVEEKSFSLGYIPVVKIDFTTDGSSLLLPIAILQVDLVNLISEIRQQIRNQGVGFLEGAEGLMASLKKMSANSVVELPTEARPTRWVVYEARGLDAHFSYAKFLSELMYSLAQKNNTSADSSGISKQWDFLDTQSVLSYMSQALTSGLTQIANIWCDYRGAEKTAQIVVSNKFDFASLREDIDNLLAGLAAGLGKMAETEIKKELRDKVATLTPEQKRISDAEIEKAVESKNEFLKTFEHFKGIGDKDGNTEIID